MKAGLSAGVVDADASDRSRRGVADQPARRSSNSTRPGCCEADLLARYQSYKTAAEHDPVTGEAFLSVRDARTRRPAPTNPRRRPMPPGVDPTSCSEADSTIAVDLRRRLCAVPKATHHHVRVLLGVRQLVPDPLVDGRPVHRAHRRGAFRKTIRKPRHGEGRVRSRVRLPPRSATNRSARSRNHDDAGRGPYKSAVPLLDTDYNRNFVLPACRAARWTRRMFGSLRRVVVPVQRRRRRSWVMDRRSPTTTLTSLSGPSVRFACTSSGRSSGPPNPAATAAVRCDRLVHDRHREPRCSGRPTSPLPAGPSTDQRPPATPPDEGHRGQPQPFRHRLAGDGLQNRRSNPCSSNCSARRLRTSPVQARDAAVDKIGAFLPPCSTRSARHRRREQEIVDPAVTSQVPRPARSPTFGRPRRRLQIDAARRLDQVRRPAITGRAGGGDNR